MLSKLHVAVSNNGVLPHKFPVEFVILPRTSFFQLDLRSWACQLNTQEKAIKPAGLLRQGFL